MLLVLVVGGALGSVAHSARVQKEAVAALRSEGVEARVCRRLGVEEGTANSPTGKRTDVAETHGLRGNSDRIWLGTS